MRTIRTLGVRLVILRASLPKRLRSSPRFRPTTESIRRSHPSPFSTPIIDRSISPGCCPNLQRPCRATRRDEAQVALARTAVECFRWRLESSPSEPAPKPAGKSLSVHAAAAKNSCASAASREHNSLPEKELQTNSEWPVFGLGPPRSPNANFQDGAPDRT